MDSVVWQGDAVGVNKWKDCRVIRKGRMSYASMYTSAVYKSYKSSLEATFKKLTPLDNFVDVNVWVFLKYGKDSDGPIKGLLDALTGSGAILDDKYVRDIHIMRHYHDARTKVKTPDTIKVQITRLSEQDIYNIEQERKNIYTHLEGQHEKLPD